MIRIRKFKLNESDDSFNKLVKDNFLQKLFEVGVKTVELDTGEIDYDSESVIFYSTYEPDWDKRITEYDGKITIIPIFKEISEDSAFIAALGNMDMEYDLVSEFKIIIEVKVTTDYYDKVYSEKYSVHIIDSIEDYWSKIDDEIFGIYWDLELAADRNTVYDDFDEYLENMRYDI